MSNGLAGQCDKASSMLALCVLAILIGATAVTKPACGQAFRQHTLNDQSQFGACCVFDVDHDGRVDVFSGGYWYQAPTWKRHVVRDVENIRGRFDDYANLPLDVNGDGWMDVVSVNYRSKSLYWVEHPGPDGLKRNKHWKKHVIDTPGPSETGRLVDIDGDGRYDVLPNGVKFAAWYRLQSKAKEDAADPNSGLPQWIQEPLPEQLIGHGIGHGDIDGDGRTDLVGPSGWAQGPRDARKHRWNWRPEFRLHRDCGIPILVFDVDGDGDSDIAWGRGHNVGLYWLEQHNSREPGVAGSSKLWTQHTIDTEIAGAHSLMLADIDNDGRKDIVTGKRYLGHDGKDPAEYDPLAIYWYRFDNELRTWKRNVISPPDDIGFDLDPKVADLDGDGDLDVVAPSRNGLYWFENLGGENIDPPREQSLAAPYPDHSQLMIVRDSDGTMQPITERFQWGHRRMHILDGMQHAMGPLPQPRHRAPLRVEVKKRESTEHYDRLTIRYQPEPGDWVPAYLLVPKNLTGRLPAMLCLHQTTRIGKGEPAGLGGRATLQYAHELANRGYVCLAPDYPSFGDYDFDFAKQKVAQSGSMKAIWNNIRAVDLLESRPEVDADRIGVVGHSLGGHNALFTAAFDQRLRAVVTSCGFNAFHDYYGGNLKGWTSDRYMPRIAQRYHNSPDQVPFDFYEVVAAIAPRPLFINAPLHDSNFEVNGVKKVVAEAAKVYAFTEAAEALHAEYPDSAHDFPDDVRQQAYGWLDKQLKP